MSYAAYHARDWATGETDDAVREELARVEAKINHTYDWQEVGNATLDYHRIKTLKEILTERTYENHHTHDSGRQENRAA